jgi:hypothetical protein
VVLSEAGHTQSRASPEMGVAERSREAPSASQPRGFLLAERKGGYARKSNKGIDRGGYVEERKAL